jgi:signal transduction histidine kinase
MNRARTYQGSFLVGYLVIVAVAIRTSIHFLGQAAFGALVALLTIYTLLYSLEPWLAKRFRRIPLIYLSLELIIVLIITHLQPFTDVTCLLYLPITIQVMHAFSRRAAVFAVAGFVILLAITLMNGIGWLAGLALVLLYMAVGTFLVSYDFLYSQTQADEEESRHLLADLESAHQKLQEYAAQAEELAAARERNRLARELHDSVSQAVFSITLTAQSARMLLEREPARVPEQLDRLQEMTGEALAQLRSLIAQLRPPADQ